MAITLTLSRQEADILADVLNGKMGNWIEASGTAKTDEDMSRSVLPEQRLAADKARASLKAAVSLRNRLAQAVKEDRQ
jgi:flagellar hook-basal body complex protein FliE